MSFDFAMTNLTHHLLIAMPGLADSRFSRSVIYLYEHGAHGAMGLVINKLSELNFGALFEKVGLQLAPSDLSQTPVFLGGPVQPDRGFVLHDSRQTNGQSLYGSSLLVANSGLAVTTSRDVLEAVARGDESGRLFVALGCSAWEQGQLESELMKNSWLTVACDPALIFDTPVQARYHRALELLGVNEQFLSAEPGHA